MTQERISGKQGFAITVLFLLSNCYSVLFGMGAGRDVWLSYLVALALAMALSSVLTHSMKRCDESDFFSFLDHLLTRIGGSILSLLLALYTLFSSVTSLCLFGRFNQFTALSRTPSIILPLLIVLLGVWACRSGVEALGRMASLTLYFTGVVFLIFALFGFSEQKWETLLPILQHGPTPVLRGGLAVFLNQLGDLIFLTAILPHLSRQRSFKLGVLVGGVALTVIALVTLTTLGATETAAEFYPVFTVLSIRSIGRFVQHLEVLSSIAMTIFAFFRVALSLYFVAKAVAHVFHLPDYRASLLPIGLLLVSVTQMFYQTMIGLRTRLESDLALTLMTPILVLLPFALAVIAWTKHRSQPPLG